jgi:hypothetical protein
MSFLLLKGGTSLKKEKLIEVCPVCGNSDLYYDGYAGAVYHCKECGYMGAFIVEGNEEMVEKIRENYEREKGKREEKDEK